MLPLPTHCLDSESYRLAGIAQRKPHRSKSTDIILCTPHNVTIQIRYAHTEVCYDSQRGRAGLQATNRSHSAHIHTVQYVAMEYCTSSCRASVCIRALRVDSWACATPTNQREFKPNLITQPHAHTTLSYTV